MRLSTNSLQLVKTLLFNTAIFYFLNFEIDLQWYKLSILRHLINVCYILKFCFSESPYYSFALLIYYS